MRKQKKGEDFGKLNECQISRKSGEQEQDRERSFQVLRDVKFAYASH